MTRGCHCAIKTSKWHKLRELLISSLFLTKHVLRTSSDQDLFARTYVISVIMVSWLIGCTIHAHIISVRTVRVFARTHQVPLLLGMHEVCLTFATVTNMMLFFTIMHKACHLLAAFHLA